MLARERHLLTLPYSQPLKGTPRKSLKCQKSSSIHSDVLLKSRSRRRGSPLEDIADASPMIDPALMRAEAGEFSSPRMTYNTVNLVRVAKRDGCGWRLTSLAKYSSLGSCKLRILYSKRATRSTASRLHISTRCGSSWMDTRL